MYSAFWTSNNVTLNNLQATLSAATSDSSNPMIVPHHPIQCSAKLYFNDDNSFSCEHATAAPDDPRTQKCLIHTIALLIIEEALKL